MKVYPGNKDYRTSMRKQTFFFDLPDWFVVKVEGVKVRGRACATHAVNDNLHALTS